MDLMMAGQRTWPKKRSENNQLNMISQCFYVMSWYRGRLTSVNDNSKRNDWFVGVLNIGRVYKKYYDIWPAVNNNLWSLVKRLSNSFSWKSMANHRTRDHKIVVNGKSHMSEFNSPKHRRCTQKQYHTLITDELIPRSIMNMQTTSTVKVEERICSIRCNSKYFFQIRLEARN